MAPFQPVETLTGNASLGLLLIADHAMRHLPEDYGRLGLPIQEFERHIAYDIGAESVTRQLSLLMNVPAVMARFSRLLIDPNRGEDDPTLIRQLYDGAVITGNYPLASDERQLRLERYFRPFRQAVFDEAVICDTACGGACVIVSIHSFTPVMAGRARPWHIGLLWDKDDRVAKPLLVGLEREGGLVVGDNEPYDGALKGDTLHELGTKPGRAHVLIEIRQDLIGDEKGAMEWAQRLAPLLLALNSNPDLHSFRQFGSRTD